ncbi:MAG TPA: XRE family transcriptional regulator [Prolixibacteraceae bacterium]|nr:XRE family transcriptional regulator [Prolixibacteraceae bacterium]
MGTKRDVGKKIQAIRESKFISIDELSIRCNLSREQIELIEDNKILPSLAPLIKIARSLGVSLGTFLDENEQLDPVVTLANEKNKSACFSNKNIKARSHMDFFPLACNKASRHMEPFIIDLKTENENDHMLSSHEGEEFIYVLEGAIEINYGKNTYILNERDSIYYDSIVAHNVHAYESKKAVIIAVIYTPF